MNAGEYATFSVRMPEALKQRVEVIAREHYSTRNGMICLAVARLVEGAESGKETPVEASESGKEGAA